MGICKFISDNYTNLAKGGKKRFYYHDDLWNIKYLPGFKWDHLTGQIGRFQNLILAVSCKLTGIIPICLFNNVAYEKAARTKRLQMEISQARRENKDYIRKVERSKIMAKRREKAERKEKRKEKEKEKEKEEGKAEGNEDVISASAAL